MDKEIRTFSENDMLNFIDNLIQTKKYEVVGPKSKGIRFSFDTLENADNIRLDYDVTILPPKKYFLPQYEDLMEFKLKEKFNVKDKLEDKKRILVGVHPYDIIAIEQMDKVYLDDQKDDFYEKRRKNTIIIGVDIQKVSERSFAKSLGTNIVETGFDLLLTKINDNYTVTIGSKKGKELLDKYAKTKQASKSDIDEISKARKKVSKDYKKEVKTNDWSKLLIANYDNAIWEERSDKCMECSSCTMVCPTCYCYDIRDEVSIDLKDGRRVRTWDGCMIRDFTKIGSGEVFREEKKERYRHRFFRKGNYLNERYGFLACVGCGRCGIACLPDIADPCELINDLTIFGGEGKTDKFFIKQKTEVKEKGTIHIPRPATIKRIEKLTETETLFELELDDKKPLGHKPGQFVEVSIFGIGEAPISIASEPSDKPVFELVVRKVGNVTGRMINMKAGDKLGIRGPLGNGFDVKAFEKKHLLFTSGGLGLPPMRGLIKYVLDPKNRKNYKDITILYGAKEPKFVLFQDEIEDWNKQPDVECTMTVDQCAEGECWTGCTGLITTLFPKIKLDQYDSKNTIAIVIGPPIMYKFVIKCLQTLGIPDENIYVSLERRMKCGVGKCGHCQINGIYVCKEGPVFNYAQIKELPEAFE